MVSLVYPTKNLNLSEMIAKTLNKNKQVPTHSLKPASTSYQRDSTRKGNCRLISFMNINIKILNKDYPNIKSMLDLS